MNTGSLEEIRGKYLLLDTNVLVDAAKYPLEFLEFFTTIRSHEVSAVLEQTIKFEFLRGVRSDKEREKEEEFIAKLFGKKSDRLELIANEETYSEARKISSILYRAGNKETKLADSLISAQVARFMESPMGRLYLATQNHKDFPPTLFERIYVQVIPIRDGSIKTVGIYRFVAVEIYERLKAHSSFPKPS